MLEEGIEPMLPRWGREVWLTGAGIVPVPMKARCFAASPLVSRWQPEAKGKHRLTRDYPADDSKRSAWRKREMNRQY